MVRRPDPTPRQPGKAAQAAVMLARGETMRATAAAIGVHERTVRRWAATPKFRGRVEEHRSAMISEAVGKLSVESAEAVAVLGRILRSKKASDMAKLSAARAILEKLPMMHEYFSLSERVRQLEERTQEGESWRH